MAPMTINTVREMEPAEVETVREVLRAANAQFAGLVPKALHEAYLGNVLDIEARQAASRTLVAEHDGRIVGTITYYRDANDEGVGPAAPPDTAGIRAVAVSPEARGLGIGRRLAEAAIAAARADDATGIVLHTWQIMEAAIAVYEALGFRRAPGFDAASGDFFPTGIEDDPTALAFWLDLASTADPGIDPVDRRLGVRS